MDFIKSSILMSIQTGSDTMDSIIALFILTLFSGISIDFKSIISYVKNLFAVKRKSEYLIQGKVTNSTDLCLHYTNFPNEYRAIMYKLDQLGVDIKYAKQFNNKKRFEFGETTSNSFSYSLNSKFSIKVNSDIYIRQENDIDKSSDLKASAETYNLYVYSPTLTFVELKNIINEWNDEFSKYVKEYNDGNYYFFSCTGSSKNKDDNNALQFESNVFETNKTFNNTFFEGRDEVINRLNLFLNNSERYKRVGIPHSIGFMFYGSPGCGKTSTIKAIANYTKRHIVEISLSKIKTCTELRKAFLNDMINGFYVPANKKIIVLEDIDCMGDIVKHRGRDLEKEEKKLIPNIDLKQYLAIKEGKAELLDSSFRDESDKLTLSYILSLLDGVLEQPGRIIVITTNRPKDLDSALIRPGRVDMEVEFKKCSNAIIKQIIELYFDIESNFEFDIPEYTYTQAEVFKICFNNDDINKVYIELKTSYRNKNNYINYTEASTSS